MGRKNSFNIGLMFSVILLFSFIPTLALSASKFENEHQMVSNSTITVSNFADFEKFQEEALIHSTKNDTHIDFLFDTSSPSHPLLERYEYILPVNCSDFSVSIKLYYSMSSVSEGMIAFFSAYGEDHKILETGMQDAWIASQGLFYVKGYPFGVSEEHKSNTNSAGISGTVTFQISRTDNVVTGEILNEDATSVLYSYQYTEGFDTKIYRIGVSFRTNFDATKMSATFSELNADFTYESLGTNIFGFTSNSLLLLSSVVFIIIFMRRKRKDK